MGRVVIACHRPKPRPQEGLRTLVEAHVSTPHSLGFVTARRPITMEAVDVTVFGKVYDCIPVAPVPDASTLFSDLPPIEMVG